ncbi:MAG: bifunctional DNA-formamidopyrimidine glycosylase/DNA-(apurinic or apyrimidinic site) lyase [Sciscionella sp.]|nr:bifunctional DNA-formamidopyrimidine glycosylase/DNA-(apurinic or apyrimidinic site) lyase [Sciscionella sp.]
MPELPEVEVVRRGLAEHVVGQTVAAVEVLHPRAIRRHEPGAADFARRLAGRTITAAHRRGKYLWLTVDADFALLAHLGMSGQFLLRPVDAHDEVHLRVRFSFTGKDFQLRFVDQRTFGGLSLAGLADVDGEWVPTPVAHIGRDPMDPRFDVGRAVVALRGRRTEVKRALLDQSLVSGIGNIYADEALWLARVHGSRPTWLLSQARGVALFDAVREVLDAALAAGGTSFDSLYVNVNGQSGYFSRSLAVYGRVDQPCPRCGAAIRRVPFMNRSSYFCPRCQRKPAH